MTLLCRLLESSDLETVQLSKLSFITEQMRVLFKSPKSRRYLPGILSVRLLWQNSQALRALSSVITIVTGLPVSIVKYLGARIKDVNSRELYVTLMIDEVFSAQRVEFVKGMLLGCEDNQTTKTGLTFMIKSARRKYMFVVGLVQVAKTPAELIYNQYTPIMNTLHQIRFIDVSVDSQPANTNFHTKLLCCGEFQTSIRHPHNSRRKGYLLFKIN
nr:uncharacterized protein LOC121120871 [Lepeophtheirus salmonis]XP_040571701.1 uncharacterized protein LOC121120871 [Lepeophtheirus salmonis]